MLPSSIDIFGTSLIRSDVLSWNLMQYRQQINGCFAVRLKSKSPSICGHLSGGTSEQQKKARSQRTPRARMKKNFHNSIIKKSTAQAYQSVKKLYPTPDTPPTNINWCVSKNLFAANTLSTGFVCGCLPTQQQKKSSCQRQLTWLHFSA